MNVPCRDCKDRITDGSGNCHSTCEKYIAFRTERDAMLEKKQRQAELDEMFIENKRKLRWRK